MNRRLTPYALATGAGLALLGAHPPIDLPLLAFVAPVLLLAAVDAARRQGSRTWAVGAAFGLVFHAPLLIWLVQPAGFIGWALLAAIQVAWYVLLTLLARAVQPTSWVILGLPAVWVGVDAWRSSIPLGGFAWGSIEYSQVANGWLLPVARLAGGRALGFVVVLLAAAFYEAVRRVVDATRDPDGAIRVQHLRATLPEGNRGAAVLAGAMLGVVLVTVGPPPADGTADVLVVQGNDIEDWVGSSRGLDEAIAATMLDETRRAIGTRPPPDLTIWPESSIDRDPNRPDAAVIRGYVEEAARLTDGRLLAGVNLEGPRDGTFVNASVLFDASGTAVDRYEKRRLVPFGEYVPFRSALDWFPPLRQVPRDAVAGPGPDIVEIGPVRAAVAICFETLFPRVVRSNVLAEDEPANLLVASTNDASFGRSAEPEQHLSQTRLRAIETGRWAVHGAVSGRTTIVDPDGRVVEPRTELFTIDHRRREIPLASGATPYLITGDWVGVVARTAVLGLAAWGLIRRRRRTV